MAKIQLLAVLSLDGCLSDMETEGRFWLNPEIHGIDKIRRKAVSWLTSNHSLTQLIIDHEKQDGAVYLMEATTETADFINGMLRVRIIDEIILYIVPFIAGTGIRLFQGNLPTSHWKLVERKDFKRASRLTFQRIEVKED